MYCGIDLSKDKSNVCIIDNDKTIVSEFEIQHTREGFEKLEKSLTKETVIAMETTGNYSKALYEYLCKNYKVYFVDNIQMKNFARLHYLNLKNDKIDARLIALYLVYDLKKITTIKHDELKDLSRLYCKTIKQLTIYKFMFKEQLSMIFPELEKNFHLKRTKAIASLLQEYPRPQDIAKLTETQIAVLLTKNLHKTSFRDKDKAAQKLLRIAKESIGVLDYPVLCFRYTIKILLFYQALVDEISKMMRECLDKTPYSGLLNLWGYKDKSISAIVGEVGDIRRFSSHRKFVKYCGLDVSENQSGKSQSVNCFISKRGSRVLRSIFYNMCLTHIRYKTEPSKFYFRLKAKGKHSKKCMVAFSRKLAVKAYYDLMKCHTQTQGSDSSEPKVADKLY
jgi:transposase